MRVVRRTPQRCCCAADMLSTSRVDESETRPPVRPQRLVPRARRADRVRSRRLADHLTHLVILITSPSEQPSTARSKSLRIMIPVPVPEPARGPHLHDPTPGFRQPHFPFAPPSQAKWRMAVRLSLTERLAAALVALALPPSPASASAPTMAGSTGVVLRIVAAFSGRQQTR